MAFIPIQCYNDDLRPLQTVSLIRIQCISERKAYLGKAACGLHCAILDMTGGDPEENLCAVLGSMSVAFCKVKWRLTGNAFIAKIVGRELDLHAPKVVGCHWPVPLSFLPLYQC